MGYYALLYREVVPDFIERRAAFRDKHLGLAREAHARGDLVLAGAGFAAVRRTRPRLGTGTPIEPPEPHPGESS